MLLYLNNFVLFAVENMQNNKNFKLIFVKFCIYFDYLLILVQKI